MAVALVQSNVQASGGTNATIGAGNGLSSIVADEWVVVAVLAVGTTPTSVTDNGGNSYTMIGPFSTGSGMDLYFAYCLATSGATTITVNGTSTYNNVYKFTGVLSYDTHGSSTGTGTTLSTTISPSDTNRFIIGFGLTHAMVAGDPWTAGTNYTKASAYLLYIGRSGQGEYRLSGAGTSETVELTHSSSAAWMMFAIAFNPYVPPTNIKTVNGLAKASVKTWNGLAIASVKSINGLE